MPTTLSLPLRRSPRRHTPPETSPVNSPSRRSPRATGMDLTDGGVANIQRRLSITRGDEENVEMIDLATDDMAKAYTFLKRQSRVVLRNMGKEWGRRGTGNKKEFLYRNLLFLLDGKRAGRDVTVMLQENTKSPSFESFLKTADDDCISFEQCPYENSIREHLRSVGDPEERPTNSASRASGTSRSESGYNGTKFSVSEFARLFLMLKDDHVCKQALLKLTQDLKRADFEAVRTRESFWKEIESLFNDHSLKYHQSFEGSVPEANSAKPPLCYRSFYVLKAQVQNARKSFTLVYANYCQSGQNDPDNWPEFWIRDRNGEFLASS